MKYYVADAFADRVFSGNPAGVCWLDKAIDDKTMQNIAAENNLAETAFISRAGDDYDLRWFTPEIEVDLCGHATLASAFVVSNFVDVNKAFMRFNTLSGILTVMRAGDFYEMDFPSRVPEKCEVTALMSDAINEQIIEAHLSRDLLLLLGSEEIVKNLRPDLEMLRKIPDCFAVIVTAKGYDVDFVSRFFAPNAGIPEDPVTGSSHSTLIPYWAKRLEKNEMIAKQLSKRGGTLFCKDCNERVKIAGKAVLYATAEIHI